MLNEKQIANDRETIHDATDIGKAWQDLFVCDAHDL